MRKYLIVLLSVILTLNACGTKNPVVQTQQYSENLLLENELHKKAQGFDSDKFADEFLAEIDLYERAQNFDSDKFADEFLAKTQHSSTYKNATAKYLYEDAGEKLFTLQSKVKNYNSHRLDSEELEEYSQNFFFYLVEKDVFAKKIERGETIKENWVATTQFRQYVIRKNQEEAQNPLCRMRGKRTQNETEKGKQASANPTTNKKITKSDEDGKQISVDYVDSSSLTVEEEYETKTLRETFHKVIISYNTKRKRTEYNELWKDILSQMLDKMAGIKTLTHTQIAEKHNMKANAYRNEKNKLSEVLAKSEELRSFL